MPNDSTALKAQPLKLKPGLSLEQAFAQIVRNCLQQIRANEAGLVAGRDPEFVHQMRVGLRRLRSALSLFKPWIRLPTALAEEIAWLGGRLGAARDAEVLAGTTLPALRRDSAEIENLDTLQQAANALARRRRRAAVIALQSQRYRELLASLEQWLETSAWRAAAPAAAALEQAVRKAAGPLLKQRQDKVRKRLLALHQQASAERRHALRIAVKKLRYASEFFCSLAAAHVGARLQQLSALQELLGQLNDAAVGNRLLLALERAAPGQIGFARGLLWAQSQQRLSQLAAQLRAYEPDKNGV